MSSSRHKIFAGNWKMNFSPADAVSFFEQLYSELEKMAALKASTNADISRVIFPQAFCLQDHVKALASKVSIELGAQNTYSEDKGAFTGELSPKHLKDMGYSWTLLGHSERRQFFGETDDTLSKRFHRAILCGLNIIYCVGETLTERESGKMDEILSRQLSAYCKVLKSPETIASITKFNLRIAIAYEPVWAIGTGKTATPEQATEAHKFIRDYILSNTTPILYGGSVTAENAKTLLSSPNIDGVLVGGASLKPLDFATILASLPR